MYRGQFTFISFILPPMRDRQLLNYHSRCGMPHCFKHNSVDIHRSNRSLHCVIQRLPFHWKHPFGFLIATTMQYTVFSYAMKIGACLMSFAVGLNFYVVAMSKYVKQHLSAIKRSHRSKFKRRLIRKQLIEYIAFDSSVKRWAAQKTLAHSSAFSNE